MTLRNILLFDLDGTLIDSAPDLALAVNDTMQQLGRKTFASDTVRGWVGNGAKTLIERGLSGDLQIDPNLDPALAEQALTLFLASYTKNVCVDTVLYDGVKTSLETLKEQGYRLAIVTNKPEGFVEPILQKLGLGNIFECIVGGDTLPQRKPDPAPLLYACEKMQGSMDQVIMIGDSRNDVLAAKAANVPCVALSYGYNYGEDLAQYEPDWLLDHFGDLPNAIA